MCIRDRYQRRVHGKSKNNHKKSLMNLSTINPVIIDAVCKNFPYSEEFRYSGNDYDNAFFEIFTIEHKLQFSFRYPNFKQIASCFPQNHLQQFFPHFQQKQQPNEGFDITFQLDLNAHMKEGDSEAKNKSVLTQLGQEIAIFRTAFLGGPFESTFTDILNGKQCSPLFYELRPNENVWIVPAQTMATIYFTLNFTDTLERQLIKLILIEMEEAKRHVPNPPSVSKLIEDNYPEALIAVFPQLKDKKLDNSCMIGITLVKQSHFGDAKSIRNGANLLAGFRQYLHYHIHGMKTYLHGRIRKKVAYLEKIIKQAKFEQEISNEKIVKDYDDEDNNRNDLTQGIYRI
eukprot:TRINITY_DN1671_c0_g1_i1.p1 TRINITY_DN1671_c0_g1~~TRINITY_DN1671_c0_g1_i1.p1  ORF type:complete len:344 (-),score=51.79 TRINITY_DN1671_c0_g1_i1:71-1102(-)